MKRNLTFLSLSPGFSTPVSEVTVGSGAKGKSGQEWKTLRGRASLLGKRKRNLSAAGGLAALSVGHATQPSDSGLQQEKDAEHTLDGNCFIFLF